MNDQPEGPDPKDPTHPEPPAEDPKNPNGGSPESEEQPDLPPEARAPGVSGLVEQPVTLTITVTGPKLEIHGPLHDVLFCYGVLERAKDIIRDQMRQRATVPAPGQTPSGLVIPTMGFKTPDPRRR